MLSLEFSGKTVKAAIEEGLSKLNKSIDEVEVKILNQGGFLRKAKILISFSDPLLERAKAATQPENNAPKKEPMPKPNGAKQEPAPKRTEDEAKQNNKPQSLRTEQDKPQINKEQKGSNENQKRKQPQKTDNRNETKRTDNRGGKGNDKSNDANTKHVARERVYAPISEETANKAEEFLRGILSKFSIEYELEKKLEDCALAFEITCESGVVIGYRGETLNAIESLMFAAVGKDDDKVYRVTIDCNGYKKKREEALVGLAQRMAQKAIKTNRKVVLEPMTSSSRRIIHSVLSENDRIITRSEGNEPNRCIVIIPKRY